MRIAMVGPFGMRPKGTMAVRAQPLARALVGRGHQVWIFIPPWSFPQDAGQEWVDSGVAIVNVPIYPRYFIPFRLFRGVLDSKPDVVHIFKPKGYAGACQWLLWQRRNLGAAKPRIVLDTDDWEGFGGWNDIEPYNAAQKKIFAWQEGWGLQHADAVTVASRALETIVWSHGRPPKTVFYMPNGVNCIPARVMSRGEARRQLGLPDGPLMLLYTRFFEFELERLYAILSRVFERIPRAKLLVVGKGLYGEEERFLDGVRARGWAERVIFRGWVEEIELGLVFAASDVAIYPFDDTLVNRCKAIVKLMDLLGAGVPVVADSVGQIAEYMRWGSSGLVEPGNVEQFANAVIRLLEDEALREQVGKRAQESVRRDYDWDKVAETAEDAYGKHLSSIHK